MLRKSQEFIVVMPSAGTKHNSSCFGWPKPPQQQPGAAEAVVMLSARQAQQQPCHPRGRQISKFQPIGGLRWKESQGAGLAWFRLV